MISAHQQLASKAVGLPSTPLGFSAFSLPSLGAGQWVALSGAWSGGCRWVPGQWAVGLAKHA